MKTVVKDVETWKKRLEIEVPVEDMEPVIEKTFKRYQKAARIDGFRKGKAPMSIIKKRFSESVEADAVDDLIKEFYPKAIDEHNLPVVAPGEIKDISYEKEKPLKFTAEVEVEPEIKPGHYKGIKVEKVKVDVKDEDVQDVINSLLEQYAEWNVVERGAQKGDMVEGDMQALDDSGVAIIGQRWQDRAIIVGEPPLGNLLEDQLIDAKAGDQRKLTVIPPDEKGKPQKDMAKLFMMDVKAIKVKKLPELTDEFVKDKYKFDTVDALKTRVRENLNAEWTRDVEDSVQRQLIDEILKKNNFELPPSMIHNALDNLWEDYQKDNRRQQTDREAFDEQNLTMVIWNLKWQILWPKIAEAEAIDVTDKAIDAEIERMVKANEKEAKKIQVMFKKPERRERLKHNLLEKELFAYLTDHGKVKEISRKKNEKKKKSSLITS